MKANATFIGSSQNHRQTKMDLSLACYFRQILLPTMQYLIFLIRFQFRTSVIWANYAAFFRNLRKIFLNYEKNYLRISRLEKKVFSGHSSG